MSKTTFNEDLKQVRKKYQAYIDNLVWHIKTNNPADAVLQRLRVENWKEIVSDLDTLAASKLHPSPTHDVEDGKQVIELLVRCKHALGILSTICGVADLPEGKEVANKILKDIIAYFPKGNIEDCLRSNDANGANMMQSEIDKIKELIKPWQQMEKNIDDYACAKNERQKEKAMVRGIEIRRSMETNLKELVKILYERTPAIQ